MRSADKRPLAALIALCVAGVAGAQDKTYNRVETFEPGKKYSCVPTADRKGWDCAQTGKASDRPVETPTPAPTPAATTPPPTPTPAPVESAAAPAPVSATRSSELPGYLSASRANGGPAPQISGTRPVPAPKVETSTKSPVVEAAPAAPAPAAERVVAAKPASSPAAPPATASEASAPMPSAPPAPSEPSRATAQSVPPPVAAPEPPPPAPVAAPPAQHSTAALSGDADFLALPGEQYVIELAHGGNAADLDGVAAPDHGRVYKLHLRQNGADAWLLVWGSFSDVSAARAARAEISGVAGWPRRIAPLQAEVRRAQ